jgi:hypothetical protein
VFVHLKKDSVVSSAKGEIREGKMRPLSLHFHPLLQAPFPHGMALPQEHKADSFGETNEGNRKTETSLVVDQV